MDLFKKTALDSKTLAEIKRLHIQTRRLADHSLAGSYRSAFRGRGMEFEEVRAYVPGDDVRSIDWKVTARVGQPHIKSYREERELTVILAIDVSASTLTGTRSQLRESLIAKVGAVITLIALANNDKVGLVTFSDQLETYHPPRKARGAVWRILHEVLSPGVYRPKTDLCAMFTFLRQVLKRRAVIFVISDFFSAGYEKALAALARRHQITAISATDPADYQLPPGLLLNLQDPESGERLLLDSAYPPAVELYRRLAAEQQQQVRSRFLKYGADYLELDTSLPFMPKLRQFFRSKKSLNIAWHPFSSS